MCAEIGPHHARDPELSRDRSDFRPGNSQSDCYLYIEGHRAQNCLPVRLLELGGIAVSLKKAEPTGEYLDARAFGELIDLSRESVYRAVARGDLQAVRVGRSIRLPRAQLDLLLAEGDRDAHAPGRPGVMVECADDC